MAQETALRRDRSAPRPQDAAAFARNLEMLRTHRVNGVGVTEVAQLFGVSRQTVYNVARAYDAGGIAALVPGKSGPRNGFKCTPEVIDFLVRCSRRQPGLNWRELAARVSVAFRVDLHPNTIRYALAKRRPA